MQPAEVPRTTVPLPIGSSMLQEACSRQRDCSQGTLSYPTPIPAPDCEVVIIPWKPPVLPMFCLYLTALALTSPQLNSISVASVPSQIQVSFMHNKDTVKAFHLYISSISTHGVAMHSQHKDNLMLFLMRCSTPNSNSGLPIPADKLQDRPFAQALKHPHHCPLGPLLLLLFLLLFTGCRLLLPVGTGTTAVIAARVS